MKQGDYNSLMWVYCTCSGKDAFNIARAAACRPEWYVKFMEAPMPPLQVPDKPAPQSKSASDKPVI